MASRYEFRDRTKQMRHKVNHKIAHGEERRRLVKESALTQKQKAPAAKARIEKKRHTNSEPANRVNDHVSAPREVFSSANMKEERPIEDGSAGSRRFSIAGNKSPKNEITIPGLTLLRPLGERIDTTRVETHQNPDRTFDSCIQACPPSIDRCPATSQKITISENVSSSKAKACQARLQALEHAQEGAGQAVETVGEPTGSMALESYLLNKYAEANIPLGESIRLNPEETNPNRSDTNRASPDSNSSTKGFPWLTVSWEASKKSYTGPSSPQEQISPPSILHTMSISVVRDAASEKPPTQLYHRSFNHQVVSCPHPSSCPSCRFNPSELEWSTEEEVPIETALSFQSEMLNSVPLTSAPLSYEETKISELEEPMGITDEGFMSPIPPLEAFPPHVVVHAPYGDQKDILPRTRSDTTSIPIALPKGDPQRLETTPLLGSRMQKALSPPGGHRICRSHCIAVSLFRADGHRVGTSIKIEISKGANFEDFKERVYESFKDDIHKASVPFDQAIYDNFVLVNRGNCIFDTSNGDEPLNVWENFVQLLEGGEKDGSEGVAGSVEIVFD